MKGMRKRISLKTRRADLSPAQFRDHYENRHVPLGLRFIETFRWRRYVRNHILESFGAPVSFDCYAEFWVDEEFDDAALDFFISSPEFQVLNDDDRRFLDITQRLSFDLAETPIAETRDPGRSVMKYAVIWKAGEEPGLDSLGAARRIVDSLGERVIEAVLDTANSVISPEAPFDTLLTLGLGDVTPLALSAIVAPGDRWSLLAIEPIETPLEQLR